MRDELFVPFFKVKTPFLEIPSKISIFLFEIKKDCLTNNFSMLLKFKFILITFNFLHPQNNPSIPPLPKKKILFF